MKNKIHPSAIVGKDVKIGKNTEIGPNAIIDDGVVIGARNKIGAGAYIGKGTTLGNDNTIHMHALIGHEPQDLKFDPNGETFTKIGNKNTFREFTTIHRGTEPGTATVIGNENYFMAYCHVAHNCILGNNIIMVNQASLTGHCHIGDKAFLSGMTGLHQFTKVGTLSLLSALSAVNKDIPPYFICGGRPAIAQGINVVGMRRAGMSQEVRTEIKECYRLLYRSGLNTSQALEQIKANYTSAEAKHLVEFIESSKRGILAGKAEETLKASKS